MLRQRGGYSVLTLSKCGSKGWQSVHSAPSGKVDVPVQSIMPVAGVPQMLQEAKHDVRGSATGAISSLARRQVQRIVAKQLQQGSPCLPASWHLASATAGQQQTRAIWSCAGGDWSCAGRRSLGN